MVERKLNKLDYSDHFQIWILRFSAVLGGVAIPLIFYTINHLNFPTEPAVCLTQLLPVAASGLLIAEDVKRRLKRERKIR